MVDINDSFVRAVLIENINTDFVNSLTSYNIHLEIKRMIEQGYFEELPADGPILKYANRKPIIIPGKRSDNETYLLVIDKRDQIHRYRLD